jgi:hypothetical protein
LKAVKNRKSLPGVDMEDGSTPQPPGYEEAVRFIDDTSILRTNIKHSTTNFSIFYATDKLWETRLLFGAGVSKFRVEAWHQMFLNNPSDPDSQRIMNDSKRTYIINELVPRGTICVEHFIKSDLSIRFQYDWKKTRRISARSLENPNDGPVIGMRNSRSVGIKLIYTP